MKQNASIESTVCKKKNWIILFQLIKLAVMNTYSRLVFSFLAYTHTQISDTNGYIKILHKNNFCWRLWVDEQDDVQSFSLTLTYFLSTY